jgi:hypothetical protein
MALCIPLPGPTALYIPPPSPTAIYLALQPSKSLYLALRLSTWPYGPLQSSIWPYSCLPSPAALYHYPHAGNTHLYRTRLEDLPYPTLPDWRDYPYRTHSGGSTLTTPIAEELTLPYPFRRHYIYRTLPYRRKLPMLLPILMRHAMRIPYQLWRIYPYRTIPIMEDYPYHTLLLAEEIPTGYPYPRWSRIHHYRSLSLYSTHGLITHMSRLDNPDLIRFVSTHSIILSLSDFDKRQNDKSSTFYRFSIIYQRYIHPIMTTRSRYLFQSTEGRSGTASGKFPVGVRVTAGKPLDATA